MGKFRGKREKRERGRKEKGTFEEKGELVGVRKGVLKRVSEIGKGKNMDFLLSAFGNMTLLGNKKITPYRTDISERTAYFFINYLLLKNVFHCIHAGRLSNKEFGGLNGAYGKDFFAHGLMA